MNVPEKSRLVAAVIAGLLAGCSRTHRTPKPEGANSAPSSPPPSPPPSTSTPTPPPTPPPTGGVTSWEPAESLKNCGFHPRELDSNLAFGSLGIAARGKDLAVTRFLRTGTKEEGQLAFGGYDTQTRTVATSHGLGKAKLLPTWVFPRKDDWVVFWFDARGLVFSKTGWAATNSKIARFAAIPIEEADRVTLLDSSQGDTLLGVAPMSVDPSAQLGLFTFLPGESLAEDVKAIGATHQAIRPKNPTVAIVSKHYFLAWEDTSSAGNSSVVALTRFNHDGHEIGSQMIVSTPGSPAKTPSIVPLGDGVLLAWVEGEPPQTSIVVRSFDKELRPIDGTQRIDLGTKPVLTPAKDGAALVFLRHTTDPKLSHAATIAINAKGLPASRGFLLSPPNHPKDSIAQIPGVTSSEDDWIAAVFTFSTGMRSQLRTFKYSCLTTPLPHAHPHTPCRSCSPLLYDNSTCPKTQ